MKLGKKQEYKPVYSTTKSTIYLSDKEVEILWNKIPYTHVSIVPKKDILYTDNGRWIELVEYPGKSEPSKWL